MVRNKDEEENGKFRLVSEIQIIYQSVHPLNMHIESEEKKIGSSYGIRVKSIKMENHLHR